MKIKSHFTFNRSQRNGVFLLVFVIIGLLLVYFFLNFSSKEIAAPIQQKEVAEFQQKIDSLKKTAVSKNNFKIYPFNPNFITDYKGYTLGMSVEEIDKLHAYRKQDKWVNSKRDFQKVTGVSDSLLGKISAYFKFPEWVEDAKKEEVQRKTHVPFQKQGLNEATAEALKQIIGVGDVLSARIVKYRNSIGGFRDEIQLHDVYGLKPEVVNRIIKRFEVLNGSIFTRMNLNQISVLDMSEIPYIDYELARKIIEYRKLHEGITAFNELTKIKGFPFYKIERIKLYLTID